MEVVEIEVEVEVGEEVEAELEVGNNDKQTYIWLTKIRLSTVCRKIYIN